MDSEDEGPKQVSSEKQDMPTEPGARNGAAADDVVSNATKAWTRYAEKDDGGEGG